MNKVTLEEFDKAINELPKTNDMVSTFSSVSVKELRKAVERFEYVPSFDDLLKENNRLNNIIKETLEIYENRNTCKYKKERFMKDKSTSDLMYDALKENKDE